jgi:aspartate carbamoyltransferase regulatory subunit
MYVFKHLVIYRKESNSCGRKDNIKIEFKKTERENLNWIQAV